MTADSARVAEIRARAVRVPLTHPTAFSTREVAAREFVLVELTADDGTRGIGFTYAGDRGATVTAAAVGDLLAPCLLGEDPLRVEGLWERMYDAALLQGRTGAVMRGLSALDVALWDRNSRAAGLPLHRYLGAHAEHDVRAYASGGYYGDGGDPDALAAELRGYVAAGFEGVKIKIGRLSVAREAARVEAAREAIGPDVALMLDCNNAWRSLESALAYTTAVEPFDPYWIEEPFGPDDLDNHARLAARTPIPVATGEIEAGRWRFRELVEKGAAAIVQPDAICCGGVTELRRIAATAASFGVSVCPHAYHELHLHLTASLPNAPWTECFTDNRILNFCDLLTTRPTLEGGRIRLPAEPGLGFDFDADTVERHALAPWAARRAV